VARSCLLGTFWGVGHTAALLAAALGTITFKLTISPETERGLERVVALGVTGGIVPCPAALVVLLSALALGRLGFGLVLIVAFSVGLAAVLIAIGLLVLHARRFMARWRGEGVLLTRWLPLTSSVAITGLGLAIAAQALRTAGILQGRL